MASRARRPHAAAAALLLGLAALQLAAAGCPTAIADCSSRRASLCGALACPAGQHCWVDNCGGCRAACEPEGMVHAMSAPVGPAPGGGATPAESGVKRPAASGGGGRRPGPGGLCPCPRIYLPVCGADGKRYDNACLAECAGTAVAPQGPDADGKCAGSQRGDYGGAGPAGAATKPAPGSAGVATKPAPGAGRPARPVCPCPRIYKPVCGADGARYDNACLADCAGTAVAPQGPDADGKCAAGAATKPAAGGRPACACPLILKPVCSADGRQFANKCVADCEGVAVSPALVADPRSGKCAPAPAAAGGGGGSGQPKKAP